MKMVRSLLLGAAAGFVAIAGAQAADLPVKAKPVQYVKICDLYGAGYYYIPGTDTCIKIGGFVRVTLGYDFANGFPYTAFGGTQQYNNRLNTQDTGFRTRVQLTADVRTQTSMGTLRSYTAIQAQGAYPGDSIATFQVYRGMIQFAGFTVGRAVSYFELPDLSDLGGGGVNIGGVLGGATAPTGINLMAYTAQFGNGVSASIAIESADVRRKAIVNLGTGVAATAFGLTTGVVANSSFGSAAAVQATPAGGTPGGLTPELVANLDVTQAWGSARLSGALHNISANYWTGPTTAGCIAATPIGCGHPSDAWGYAIGAGIAITAIPGMPGDMFSITGAYTVGAAAYATPANTFIVRNGTNMSFGNVTDAVYGDGGSVQATTVWDVTASYGHRWSPTLQTLIWGGYVNVSYNGTAQALICPAGSVTPTGTGLTLATAAQCNPNFDYWQLGTRLLNWTPVPNLDIGLDLLWVRTNSAYAGAALAPAMGANPAGTINLGSQDTMMYTLNIVRSFWQ